MPRLSIIIPHRHNDQRLEATLLSVLENRPDGSEVVVVHDGSYRDPYALGDEVIFVQEDPNSSTARLLNAGVKASCSPAICVLLDGAAVSSGWSESPLAKLFGSAAATIALAVDYPSAESSFGIDAGLLDHIDLLQLGRVEATNQHISCSAPTLTCGFYLRRVLLSVGGWNDGLDESIADVELALSLRLLGLTCVCDSTTHIRTSCGSIPRKLSIVGISQLASLSVAHGAVAPGLLNSLKGFASDCLRGRFVMAAAWMTGLRDADTIRQTQVRLAHAKQRLFAQDGEPALRIYQAEETAAVGLKAA